MPGYLANPVQATSTAVITPSGNLNAVTVQDAVTELEAEKATISTPINQKTISSTLTIDDAAKLVEVSNASAITITVPLNSSVAFPIGTQISILQTNAGQVTISGAVGVTVNGTPGLKLRTQWSSATLIKRSSDVWILIGDLVV